MFKPKPLTVPGVFKDLTEIAKASGNAVSAHLRCRFWYLPIVTNEKGRDHQEASGSLSGKRSEVHRPVVGREIADRSSGQDVGRGFGACDGAEESG